MFYIMLFSTETILKSKEIHNTLTVPCEKTKIVYFASLIMKNIVALSFIIRP